MKKWILIIATLIAAAAVTARLYGCASNAPWSYRVHVLDVGQGDSILVELGNNRQLLVDGGPDATVLSELGTILPPWDRTIEYVALTHPHADHAMGLIHVFDRYDVETMMMTGVPYASPVYDALKRVIEREGSTVADPMVTSRLIDGAVTVDVLYPTRDAVLVESDNVNETSLVLLIDDGVHRALLMGDAGVDVERAIDAKLMDVDFLKVGHQGSRTSSGRSFLDHVRPEIAIISVGEDNEYGHPHKVVLKRLQDIGANVYRTDRDGRVMATFGDDGIRVKTGADGWTERMVRAIVSSNYSCDL